MSLEHLSNNIGVANLKGDRKLIDNIAAESVSREERWRSVYGVVYNPVNAEALSAMAPNVSRTNGVKEMCRRSTSLL